jgi:hypothetical protein
MSNFPGATWTSSHIYGQGLKNLSRKFCYVQIPKCASMWVRQYFAQLGVSLADTWPESNFATDDLTDYQYIVVLRDPVKRWISNCPAVDQVSNIINNPRCIDQVFDNLKDWLYDEHSAPQFDFINGLDFSKVVFFNSDQYLSANLQHFVMQHGFTDIVPPLPVNEQSQDSIIVKVAKVWEFMLSDPVNFEKFKQVFANDYKLIESVNFYREGEIKEHNVAG